MANVDKCKCYYEVEETRHLPPLAATAYGSAFYSVKVGHCSGTKECDICACGGDRRICDFYDYVRAKANEPGAEPVESLESIEKRESDSQPEYVAAGIESLIKFRRAFCYDAEGSEKADQGLFRCEECPFQTSTGTCLVKRFIWNNGTKKQRKEMLL